MAAHEEERSAQDNESITDNELEQYGVWVKVGPEDVSDEETSEEDYTLSDLSDDDLEAPDAEFSLDDGMDVSLNIGDSPDDEIELDEGEGVEELSSSEEDLLSLDDGDMELSLENGTEELGLDQLDQLDEPEPLDAEPVESEDELLSIDEIENGEDAIELSDDVTETADLDSIDEELDSLDLESITEDTPSIVADDDLPDSLDDIKLDPESLDVDSFEQTHGEPQEAPEFGELDEVQPEPVDASVEEPDDLNDELDDLGDLGDLESLSEDETDELSLELEDDIDLDSLEEDTSDELLPQTEQTVTEQVDEDEAEIIELDLSSLPDDEDVDLDLSALDSETDAEPLPELEVDDGVSMSLDEGFDDVAAVEDDMFEDLPATSGTQDRLASIQQEIHELRKQMNEISALREELHAIQGALTAGRTSADSASTVIESIDAQDGGGGFFEDDEDEKFQLTEDELDNIMNTAEFTEEAGQPTNAEEYGIIDGFSEPTDNEPLSDVGGPLQEITLEDGPEDLAALDIDISDDQETDLFEEEETLEERNVPFADVDVETEIADIPPLQDTSDDDFGEASQRKQQNTPESASAPADDEILEAEPVDLEKDTPSAERVAAMAGATGSVVPDNLKEDLRSVIAYMDTLLDSLPEEKVQEFANSEHFETYRSLFVELGLEVE